MVANARPAADPSAHPTGREPVYRPGQLVRFRPVKGMEANPAYAALVGGGAKEWIVVAVVREEWSHGSRVNYRVTDGVAVHVIDAAFVVRVLPPARDLDEATARACERVRHETAEAARPIRVGGPIDWAELPGPVWQSPDRRFQISRNASSHAPHLATDAWTGESSGALALRESAEAWCRARLRGDPLSWDKEADGVLVARFRDAEFRVFPMPGGRVFATDSRLPAAADDAPASPLRQSPWFDTVEQAQRWCEVRAACRAEPGGTLRWDPIPF